MAVLHKEERMASITFQSADGKSQTVEVSEGTSVMRAAIINGVAGIVGECGGQAMCATCHVYVDDDPGLPAIGDAEEELLECTAAPRSQESRLACQLKAGTHFTALTVRLPERQV
jgi:2Fe-2S ferredoxin